MTRHPSALLLLWLAATAGCVSKDRIPPDSTDVARIAGRAVPFPELAGVKLGMRLDSLRAIRPQATERADIGLVEDLAGDTVVYQRDSAAGSVASGAGPRLMGVVVWRRLPVSDSTALTMWRQLAAALDRGRPTPRACYVSANDGAAQHAAVWTAEAHAAAVIVQPPLLRIAVGKNLGTVLTDVQAWNPTPCP